MARELTSIAIAIPFASNGSASMCLAADDATHNLWRHVVGVGRRHDLLLVMREAAFVTLDNGS
jgi:hypothetical protein